MTPVEIIRSVLQSGGSIWSEAEDQNLHLEEVPAALIPLIRKHKAEILLILEDIRYAAEERAAIAEYDGGLGKKEAEIVAGRCDPTRAVAHAMGSDSV